jgi:hypothetical protein
MTMKVEAPITTMQVGLGEMSALMNRLEVEGIDEPDVMCSMALQVTENMSMFAVDFANSLFPCIKEKGCEHPEVADAVVLGFGMLLEVWSQSGGAPQMTRTKADRLLAISREFKLTKLEPSVACKGKA